ncbi:hypothetical protein JDN40_02410 [Rhodomicrobium vannielii ATCC 17100]|uniref:hypothetical protein n=1 Tax=Rhodomicrobium vannielii TaxID=1069 RepID=UPI001918D12B|nr:hypothetical protein [Rhodomicrobium vannielii]MBJ7532968.1 hypothetical protein [Rhodomicrobium vannielii ATCC 17100]
MRAYQLNLPRDNAQAEGDLPSEAVGRARLLSTRFDPALAEVALSNEFVPQRLDFSGVAAAVARDVRHKLWTICDDPRGEHSSALAGMVRRFAQEQRIRTGAEPAIMLTVWALDQAASPNANAEESGSKTLCLTDDSGTPLHACITAVNGTSETRSKVDLLSLLHRVHVLLAQLQGIDRTGADSQLLLNQQAKLSGFINAAQSLGRNLARANEKLKEGQAFDARAAADALNKMQQLLNGLPNRERAIASEAMLGLQKMLGNAPALSPILPHLNERLFPNLNTTILESRYSANPVPPAAHVSPAAAMPIRGAVGNDNAAKQTAQASQAARAAERVTSDRFAQKPQQSQSLSLGPREQEKLPNRIEARHVDPKGDSPGHAQLKTGASSFDLKQTPASENAARFTLAGGDAGQRVLESIAFKQLSEGMATVTVSPAVSSIEATALHVQSPGRVDLAGDQNAAMRSVTENAAASAEALMPMTPQQSSVAANSNASDPGPQFIHGSAGQPPQSSNRDVLELRPEAAVSSSGGTPLSDQSARSDVDAGISQHKGSAATQLADKRDSMLISPRQHEMRAENVVADSEPSDLRPFDRVAQALGHPPGCTCSLCSRASEIRIDAATVSAAEKLARMTSAASEPTEAVGSALPAVDIIIQSEIRPFDRVAQDLGHPAGCSCAVCARTSASKVDAVPVSAADKFARLTALKQSGGARPAPTG